ncbi:MAG: cell division protein SepF [Lachnospiraceae bacterium]|nr:cell division protein SepF [Lachnospiraceae bacterium]
MAGIFDKFINSMKINDDDEDDDFDYEEIDEEDVEQTYEEDEDDYEEPAPKKKFFNREKAVDNMERQDAQKFSRKDENVVPIRTGSRGMEVCMVKATSVEDGREICDILLSGRAVVINLEGMHTEVAQRIIDFASGACYTMNGNLQMISNYIFIATPQTVELSGDFQNLLGSDGSSMTNYDLNM